VSGRSVAEVSTSGDVLGSGMYAASSKFLARARMVTHFRSQDVTYNGDWTARSQLLLTWRTQDQSRNPSEAIRRVPSASRIVLGLNRGVPGKTRERPKGVGVHFAGGRLIGGIQTASAKWR
jgi:hypothetical protein